QSSRKRRRSSVLQIPVNKGKEDDESDIETTGKLFTCTQCEKTFDTAFSLNKHISVHAGIACGTCGYRYKNEESLAKHFAERHPGLDVTKKSIEDVQKMRCDICGLQCKARAHLEEHMRTHTGERPFACGKCHNTFTAASRLKYHQRNAHGE
ncbi:hypothetical protein PENTCL1PPCAC_4008, partial [Pristionchus entomophagus]